MKELEIHLDQNKGSLTKWVNLKYISWINLLNPDSTQAHFSSIQPYKPKPPEQIGGS